MRYGYFGAALALAFVFGCGKKDEMTVVTPDGKATVSSDSEGKTVVETDKGKLEVDGDGKNFSMTTTDSDGKQTTVSGGADFDMAEMGMPLYPGSKLKDEAQAKSSVSGPMGTMMTVVSYTSDSPEKVIDFYKDKLKEAKPFSGPEAGLVTGKSEDGHDVSVAVTTLSETKETMVTLSVTKK
ncbi:MAG TPA: hypothetical protein PLX06_07205 [Fimbriimonadaceae bacterium]|nr:hypothetical protein [Fimbriimonadaceae bacterium]